MSFLSRWFAVNKQPTPELAASRNPKAESAQDSDPFGEDPTFSDDNSDIPKVPEPQGEAIESEGKSLFSNQASVFEQKHDNLTLVGDQLFSRANATDSEVVFDDMLEPNEPSLNSTALSDDFSLDINPATSLPMMGGLGGVDAGGNAFGCSDSIGIDTGIGSDFGLGVGMNDSMGSSFDDNMGSSFDDSFSCSSSFDNDW
ncbi:hypothetical protein [Ferrimonas aestuarii]|uniref:Uncharacterized protein n=1 Tax=Ferrimonas aestuarii TaxID=2569539 RepID=A0A4U1BKC8_9GAMM|nr:hypothetical protein [Ferrimonas aestuarii]TKB51683.1 hypothetical protein FCL42_17745 [Ferrimonas aestuarii]